MKKRHATYTTAILILAIIMISGCAQRQPDIVCNPPRIRSGESCCMDQNNNSICDSEEDTLFAPKYEDSPVKDMDADITQDWMEAAQEQEEEAEPETTQEQEPEEAPEQETEQEPEVQKPVSAYKPAEPEKPKLDWKAENELMSLEINKFKIEVVPVTQRKLTDPDKMVYLKGIELTVKNKEYEYVNPKIYISMWDDSGSIYQDTFICRPSDDQFVNCDTIDQGEIRNMTINVDEKMPKPETEKNIRITLENRRDALTTNWVEITEKTNLLDLPDITYTK